MGLLKIIGLLAITPLMIYVLAVNKTVSMYRKMKTQEKVLSVMQIDSLKSSGKDIWIATNDDVKIGTVIKSITKHITSVNITTESYTPTLIYKNADMEVYAGEIVLSGGFNGLTSVLNRIENDSRGYRIASVYYRTVSDHGNQISKLMMTVIMQQVSKE
jgi:hypothetical protein